MKAFVYVIVTGAVALLIWVRIAPVDVARWHQMADAHEVGDYDTAGRFIAVRETTTSGAKVLQAITDIALATPRTRLIAGSPKEGMATFETRSAVWGFPDYTTVAMIDAGVQIHARLRFGQMDMGVNKARVQDWIAQLGLDITPPA